MVFVSVFGFYMYVYLCFKHVFICFYMYLLVFIGSSLVFIVFFFFFKYFSIGLYPKKKRGLVLINKIWFNGTLRVLCFLEVGL